MTPPLTPSRFYPGLWLTNNGQKVVITEVTPGGIVGHSMGGRIPTLLWDVEGRIIRESTPDLYDLKEPFNGEEHGSSI